MRYHEQVNGHGNVSEAVDERQRHVVCENQKTDYVRKILIIVNNELQQKIRERIDQLSLHGNVNERMVEILIIVVILVLQVKLYRMVYVRVVQ